MPVKDGVLVSQKDLDSLLFCSFRYALGRSTYITSVVSELIRDYKSALEDNTVRLIQKEIDSAIAHKRAGMDMDVQEWKKLSEELE